MRVCRGCLAREPDVLSSRGVVQCPNVSSSTRGPFSSHVDAAEEGRAEPKLSLRVWLRAAGPSDNVSPAGPTCSVTGNDQSVGAKRVRHAAHPDLHTRDGVAGQILESATGQHNNESC